MNFVRHICTAVTLAALALPLPAAAQTRPDVNQSIPSAYRLNVKVQVAHLTPEVTNVIVMCQVVDKDGMIIILNSAYTAQALMAGGFDGVISLPLTYPNAEATMRSLSDSRYECFMYLQDAAMKLWVPYPSIAANQAASNPLPPANWSNPWPEPGTPFDAVINGPFPPKPNP